MSPPIYTPDGSEVSEIVLPDGSTASQVIGPDGNVVFEAAPDIPDSGTNQWPVDEGSGTALNPRLGSVTASITGATWESDASAIGGQRLGFNGTDNRVETDSPVGATKAQTTVFGWVRPLDYTGFDNSLFSSGPDPGVSSGGGWYVDTESTSGEILSVVGSGSLHRSVPFVSPGEWGFLAFVLDGTDARLITWSNSAELADVTETAGSRANADNTLIVGDANGSGDNAEMSADIFGVADGVALSKADLTEFWEATKR